MEPTPQPSPKLDAIDRVPSVVTELLRPSLLILHPQGDMRVLLSRDTRIYPNGIQFVSSRQITIPTGWRLTLARLLARIRSVRLPDEIEFDVVWLETGLDPSPALAEDQTIGHATCPDDLVHLDVTQYAMLREMPGRQLPEAIQSLWQSASLRNSPSKRWDSAA